MPQPQPARGGGSFGGGRPPRRIQPTTYLERPRRPDEAPFRRPNFALGSIYDDRLTGERTVRMRYYSPNHRNVPSRLDLPCLVVAVQAINSCRIVRLVDHLRTDDRYDFFRFEEITASDPGNPTNLSPAAFAVSIY